jgi:hypothetical protein
VAYFNVVARYLDSSVGIVTDSTTLVRFLVEKTAAYRPLSYPGEDKAAGVYN